ncbi:BHLH domain-containing protein [Meloidogyne graminicola]|uniref:BHLH domain-containing protein n=1 Tax=Meloidogyne graminicola TaxID=189291 RepID=A0A8S9ZQB0_9BILA|nr:BHLH domain-containing protein [Meloidogyne graminicola]
MNKRTKQEIEKEFCLGIILLLMAAHNELEKNRRANLRGHLEALKSILPPENDTHRDTTLSLLTRARNYIRVSLTFLPSFCFPDKFP